MTLYEGRTGGGGGAFFFFFHLRNVDLLSGSDTAQSIILFLNQDTFSILLYR